jgi:probable addiction module antidote protein
MKKKHPPSVSYQEDLLKDLKDHEEAIAYLNAALEESKLGDNESQKILLLALKNVAEAQGGVGKVAKKSHLRREILYRILSPHGNPELRNFTALIHGMGLRLRFC